MKKTDSLKLKYDAVTFIGGIVPIKSLPTIKVNYGKIVNHLVLISKTSLFISKISNFNSKFFFMSKIKQICIFLVVILLVFQVEAKDKLSNKILYEFKGYSSKIGPPEYTLKDFFNDNQAVYDENHSLNSLFQSNTPLNGMIIHRKIYTGEAKFFKEIHLDKNLKVLLFAYEDRDSQDSYLNLFTIEMQIFDRNYNFIDKIIVVDGALGECSFEKRFRLYKNRNFEIIESENCLDIENNDRLLSEQTKITYFYIDENGRIHN